MNNKNTQILLVHGWGGSSKSLENLDKKLTEKGLQCTRINLPGFGGKQNPPKEWGVYKYAEYLKELIEKLQVTGDKLQVTSDNLKPTTVYIGHSFGGSLGIVLANKYPNLIDKLILIAPSYKRTKQVTMPSHSFFLHQGFGGQVGRQASDKLQVTSDKLQVASDKLPCLRTASSYTKVSEDKSAGRQVTSWEGLPKILKILLKPVRYIYYKIFYPTSDLFLRPDLEANFKKIIATDLTEEAQKVQTPTLILWGEKDTYTPLEHGVELSILIRNSEFKSFHDYSHSLPLLAPDELVNIINNFINK